MRSFFTHLIARSFETGERIDAVRPRIPTLFEPDRIGRQSAFFSTVADVEPTTEIVPTEKTRKNEDEPVRPDRDISRSKAPHRPSTVPIKADLMNEPFPPAESISETNDRTPVKIAAAPPANIQFAPRDGQVQPLQPPPSITLDRPVMPPEKPKKSGFGDDEPQKQNREHQPPPRRSATAPVAVVTVPVKTRVERWVESTIPADDSMQTEPAPVSPKIVPPDSQPVKPPFPFYIKRDRPGQTPKPEPTIQVTIGRVDVRAVVAPPAPVKAPRPSPAPSLTLNDYLKQRQEGRR